MTPHRGILLLGLPLVAAGLFAVALSRRPSRERSLPRTAPREDVAGGTGTEAPLPKPPTPRASPSPVPPAKTIAAAVSTARIRSSYSTFKAAVVDGNEGVQKALLPVLRRDRETALLYARDDLARATSDRDKAAARRALDALER